MPINTGGVALPTYVKVLLEGYSEEADYGELRSEMDGSLAKERPRYSIPIVKRTAKLMVNSFADYTSFQTWFRTDAKGGTAWWDYTDCLTNTVKAARFIQKIRWTAIDKNNWVADVEFETLDF